MNTKSRYQPLYVTIISRQIYTSPFYYLYYCEGIEYWNIINILQQTDVSCLHLYTEQLHTVSVFVLILGWKEILNEVIKQGDSDDSIEVEEVTTFATSDNAANSFAF